MNRRKECAPYVDPSCNAQRTQLDVHRTLARVPTVSQTTADDNDNDARGRDHETHVQEQMSRDGSAVEAGNAGPKAHTTIAGALPGQKVRQKCGIIPDGVHVQPMRPDVHGLADDADFSHRIPFRSAPHDRRPFEILPLGELSMLKSPKIH